MLETTPINEKKRSAARRFWPALFLIGLWVVCFLPMITGQTVSGFRDSAYLYFPYFRWIDSVWASGEIPLWNPYCGFGHPVVGDGSSSVFYPGKLIFFCRFLSYESRYGIYVSGHVLLAALTMYWSGRRFGAGQVGSLLAAVSFALSGCVLFQCNNVIYLVSAAWLPAALTSLWLMCRTFKLKWAVLSGIFCALMILGGDPQNVYHVGLIGLAWVVASFVRRGRWSRLHNSISAESFSRLARLALLVIVTSLLAAVQLLPSMEWSQSSVRNDCAWPRNIYEAVELKFADPGFELNDVRQGLLGTPQMDTHHDHIYQFSQPPWSLAELVWPNVSGKPFPTHRRWVDGIPGADRMWVPSIYAGCLTLILAMFSFRLWGKRRRQVWLSRVGLFFCVASFGWYGLGWFLTEIGGPSVGQDLGAPTGGLYWLMVVALPKYVAFRYPAKLVVLATYAICLLAGLSIRPLVFSRQRAIWVGGVSIGLGAIGFLAGFLLVNDGFLRNIPADQMFGPFQMDMFLAEVHSSVVQPIIVGMILVGSVFVFAGRGRRQSKVAIGLAIVILTSVDLVTANHWMTAQVDSNAIAFESLALEDSGGSNRPNEIGLLTPIAGARPEWRIDSSETRLLEVVRYQQVSQAAKFHLLEPVINYSSFSSLESRADHAFQNGGFVLPTGSQYAFLGSREEVDPTSLPSHCRVTKFEPNKISVEVDPEPHQTHLFLRQTWVPGWTATVSIDGAATGVPGSPVEPFYDHHWVLKIPQQKCKVEFSYQPQSFFLGAWISGVGWATLILIGLGFVLKMRNR